MPADQIAIAHRFRGPPGSANGGYACGVAAGLVDGPAEVTLRAPVPLDTPLDVVPVPGGLTLKHGGALVAEAGPASALDLEIPPPPSIGEAEEASKDYPGYGRHPFPGCFVCGTDRPPGEGLQIHPGPVGAEGLMAAPWTPADEWAENDEVRSEVVWAALDCPGGWAVGERSGEDAPMLLGRMSVRLDRPAMQGRPHVVAGWPAGREGRKLYAGSALWDAEGRLCAVARATWIVPRRP